MKTGARGKANSKKNYKRSMGGRMGVAAKRNSSTNEKTARYVFEEVEPETPPVDPDEGD